MGSQIDCSTYNRLQHINNYDNTVDEARLQGLAAILVKHGAHHRYLIKLLHRRFDLPPGHLMVNKWVQKDTLHCTMEPASSSAALHPYAFLADGDELIPYEYIEETTTLPSNSLAKETADYLHSNDLQHVLGIGISLPGPQPWMENQLPDMRGTVSFPQVVSAATASSDTVGRVVSTEWRVEERDSVITFRQWKDCVDIENGGHKKG